MSRGEIILQPLVFFCSFVPETVSEKLWKKPGVKLWPVRA